MQKNEYIEKTKEFLSSSRVLKLLYLVTFTVLITCIIASQNFFFQSIIENGIRYYCSKNINRRRC